jgi:hypothetical protein
MLGDVMSAAETRDAYHEVVVPLPNGKELRGKPPTYADGKTLLAAAEAFEMGKAPLTGYLALFHDKTGISENTPELADLTPAEVYDASQRFFFWRRPAPTEVPKNGASAPAPGPA